MINNSYFLLFFINQKNKNLDLNYRIGDRIYDIIFYLNCKKLKINEKFN